MGSTFGRFLKSWARYSGLGQLQFQGLDFVRADVSHCEHASVWTYSRPGSPDPAEAMPIIPREKTLGLGFAESKFVHGRLSRQREDPGPLHDLRLLKRKGVVSELALAFLGN